MCLKLAGLCDRVCSERLFDHHQLESIKFAEHLQIVNRVCGVCINHQRKFGKLRSYSDRRFDVPAGLNLYLDALITLIDVTSHAFEQLIDTVKYSDRHS